MQQADSDDESYNQNMIQETDPADRSVTYFDET